MMYVVIDLEMNHINKRYKEERKLCGMETIEIGAVCMNEEFEEMGAFSTYVKPRFNDNITGEIRKLTGIKMDMLDSAPSFAEAIKMFFAWCDRMDDDIEIYQWSENDYSQIMKEIGLKHYIPTAHEREFLIGWNNFQKQYREFLGMERDISLSDALMYAGQDFAGRKHDALYDARNTANLLGIMKDPKKRERYLSIVKEAFRPKKQGIALGDMIDLSMIQVYA